jgi:hypothetical protein
LAPRGVDGGGAQAATGLDVVDSRHVVWQRATWWGGYGAGIRARGGGWRRHPVFRRVGVGVGFCLSIDGAKPGVSLPGGEVAGNELKADVGIDISKLGGDHGRGQDARRAREDG